MPTLCVIVWSHSLFNEQTHSETKDKANLQLIPDELCFTFLLQPLLSSPICSLKLISDITPSLASKTLKPVRNSGKGFSFFLHHLAVSLLDFTQLHHVSKERSLNAQKGASTP